MCGRFISGYVLLIVLVHVYSGLAALGLLNSVAIAVVNKGGDALLYSALTSANSPAGARGEDIIPGAAPDAIEYRGGAVAHRVPRAAVVVQHDAVCPGGEDVVVCSAPDSPQVLCSTAGHRAPRAAVVATYIAACAHCEHV